MKYLTLFFDLIIFFLSLFLLEKNILITNINIIFQILIYLYLLTTVLPSIIPFFNKSLFQGRHFKKHYKENKFEIDISTIKKLNKKAYFCLFSWIFGIILFALIYKFYNLNYNHVFLCFSIILLCEWICLYVFCVFKKIIKTGKCCSTCRIKNYDNFFRFSLLIFIPGFFSYSLFFLGVFSLIQWEYLFYKYPKRFFNKTNQNINCYYCKNNNINCKKNKSKK